MEENKEIYAALVKAQEMVKPAGKSGDNKYDNYKYTMLIDYWEVSQKPLSENGLALSCSITKIEPYEERTTSKGNKERSVRVELTGTLIHTSGQYISFVMYGEGQDRSDKAIYKAVTGARKYLIASILNIPTTDDPERDSDAERDGMGKRYPEDRRPPQTGSQNTTATQPAPIKPQERQPRPTDRQMRNRTTTTPTPPLDSNQHDNLPWEKPNDGFKAHPLPDQNRLVGENELKILRDEIVKFKINIDAMLNYMEKEFKKRDPEIMSVKEMISLIDAIRKNPETINKGYGF